MAVAADHRGLFITALIAVVFAAVFIGVLAVVDDPATVTRGQTAPVGKYSAAYADEIEYDQLALFVTFDEDVNNLLTGTGNEGNHIVMVVIPSELRH
jgi:hypothetical protein